jgi:hypothetical protein
LGNLPYPWIEQEHNFTLKAPGVRCDNICETLPKIDHSMNNFVDIYKEIGSKTWNRNMAALKLLLLTVLGNCHPREERLLFQDN